MGSQVSMRCSCCGGRTEGNEDFQEEDTVKLAQHMENEEEEVPTMKMPFTHKQSVLHRTVSERTLPPN